MLCPPFGRRHDNRVELRVSTCRRQPRRRKAPRKERVRKIVVLSAHSEFSPTGQLDTAVTPAAITTSSQGTGGTFMAGGGYVLATSSAVARHDVDIQVSLYRPRNRERTSMQKDGGL
jgi:hypothetical protein